MTEIDNDNDRNMDYIERHVRARLIMADRLTKVFLGVGVTPAIARESASELANAIDKDLMTHGLELCDRNRKHD